MGIPLVAAVVFSGLVLGLGGLRVSHAQTKTKMAASHEEARQVTVFAIIATPGSKAVDSKLADIQGQLNRLLPNHGLKLRDAQSGRVVAGESVDCDLGNGCTLETSLIQPIDENGKVKAPLRAVPRQDAAILGDDQGTAQPALLLRTPVPR